MLALPLDDQARGELATAVLGAVNQEYPHQLAQELHSDADVVPPRVLNPSFFGSYDWHSAVHCHWALVRCVAAGLPDEVYEPVMSALDEHLSEERLRGELSFYTGPGGRVAERPYGWAWLVMLHAECRRLTTKPTDPSLAEAAERWSSALEPLTSLLRGRLVDYFSTVLAFPVRTGTHANTAFSLQLLQQAADAAGDSELASAVSAATRHWFADDAPLPWSGPPSGSDFLDPSLVEAALMADVLGPGGFRAWMAQVCPAYQMPDWGPTSFVPDGTDPGTVHLEGLLISRAWCLDHVGRALGPHASLARAALSGRDAHLEAIAKLDPFDGFNRAHWLPTFLVYLEGWLTSSL